MKQRLKNIDPSIMWTILLMAFLGSAAVIWPVGGSLSDSDIWYHLSGGRYFFDNGRIPQHAYFSFKSDTGPFCNYYWLFQVIAYGLYRIAGDYGLIVLRVVLFLAVVYVILRYTTGSDPSHQRLLPLLLGCAYAAAIVPREIFLIRPHLFTYFFIVLSIHVIERRKNVFWVLPIIGTAWSNLHGLAYPVFVWIVMAYLCESIVVFLFRRSQGHRLSRPQRLTLILALYTVLITPHGLAMLGEPFALPPFIHRHIGEMRAITPAFFFQFNFGTLQTAILSLQRALLLLGLVAAVFLALRRRLRISHLMLFCGAVYLLGQGVRFVYEALLLSLPATTAFVGTMSTPRLFQTIASDRFARICACCLLPLLLIGHLFSIQPRYPLSLQKFPFGIVRFLQHINVGGRILNEHNSGGFMHWHLYPAYRIFMDLQLSLFNERDLYQSVLSRRDKVVLHRVIQDEDPDFICVRHGNDRFQEVVADGVLNDFAPVFVDDGEILFVNAARHPGVAAEFGLRHLDPFAATRLDYRAMDADQLANLLHEVSAMQRLYPDGALINTIACNLLIRRGELDDADVCADRLIRAHPENHIGYALKGQVSLAQKRFAEAVSWLKKATAKPTCLKDPAVFENLHLAYFETRHYKKAFETAMKYFNVFSEKLSYNDLYRFGIYAASSGSNTICRSLMAFSNFKTPPADETHLQRLKAAEAWMSK